MLTRGQLLNAARKTKRVKITAGEIHLRELSIADTRDIAALGENDDAAAQMMVQRSLIDEGGALIFTPDDLDAIRQSLSLSAIKEITDAINLLNGFTTPTEPAEVVAEKKLPASEPTPPSSLPSTSV